MWVRTGLNLSSTSKTFNMSLLSILIAIIVVGVLLWIINTLLPMDRNIKRIFNLVVVIALVVWLLKAFGIFDYLTSIHI